MITKLPHPSHKNFQISSHKGVYGTKEDADHFFETSNFPAFLSPMIAPKGMGDSVRPVGTHRASDILGNTLPLENGANQDPPSTHPPHK